LIYWCSATKIPRLSWDWTEPTVPLPVPYGGPLPAPKFRPSLSMKAWTWRVIVDPEHQLCWWSLRIQKGQEHQSASWFVS